MGKTVAINSITDEAFYKNEAIPNLILPLIGYITCRNTNLFGSKVLWLYSRYKILKFDLQ